MNFGNYLFFQKRYLFLHLLNQDPEYCSILFPLSVFSLTKKSVMACWRFMICIYLSSFGSFFLGTDAPYS